MLRIVERLFGEGEILRAGVPAGTTGYSVAVYREWRTDGIEMVAGDFVIEGHVMLPPQQVEALLGASQLTLRLDDGRWLDFFLVGLDGAIANIDGRPLREAASA